LTHPKLPSLEAHLKIHEIFHKRIFLWKLNIYEMPHWKHQIFQKNRGYDKSCLKMGRSSKCHSNLLYHWKDLPIFREDLPYPRQNLKLWCFQWDISHMSNVTISPNVTCSVSLECYHPYLSPQKVSKILKIEWIHNSLPKITKSHIWESHAFRG
jgi:hypothetical protein